MKEFEVILKLFKSYISDSDKEVINNNINTKSGVIIEGTPSLDIIECVERMYGKNGEELNQTLHKSFKTVSECSFYELLSEQILHYFSTYGLEQLGIREDGFVYIPHEDLNIPELKDDIKMILIHKITTKQLQEKIMNLLTSNIALSEETINDLKVISDYIPKDCIEQINNKEFKIYLYDKYNLVPYDPDSFMRFVLYKITDSTCYVFNKYKYNTKKNYYTKQKEVDQNLLDSAYEEIVYKLFKTYIEIYPVDAYQNLASVFNKYKTVFMTFKKFDKRRIYNKELVKIINRISKKSRKIKIVKELYILDNLLRLSYSNEKLTEKLDKISTFRELRLLNYVYSVMCIEDYETFVKLYRIRNRKVFAKILGEKYYESLRSNSDIGMIYTFIYQHLNKRVGHNFRGKIYYIPKYLDIALPTSEKKFIENIPEKSYITIPRDKNIVFGIHWFNLEDERVDLDLHMVNKTEQFGWSSAYRSYDKQILFSGDNTDAPRPNGAGEYFLVRSDTKLNSYLITLNNYMRTYENEQMPFEFIIAETDNFDIDRDYIIDPNKIIVKMNKIMYSKNGDQTTLGLLEVNEYDIKFYFTNFDMNNTGIVTKNDQITKLIYEGFKTDIENVMYLNHMLETFGAIKSDTPYKESFREVEVNGKIYYEKVQEKVDIDLSLENLSKDTIINLFKEENK